ncbi:glycosyltransferase [uncultured Jatrophihabitans sp.]|uniref:glycosyltransferase n=1 Tax=uncultured Jatrophihabitans sp. TaxID=1610747 RepID=UPI0035C9EA58
MTRQRFRAAVDAALSADPALAERLTVTYLDLSPRVTAWKRRGFDVYWYYALWQRRLTRTARQLHAQVGFDVVHHVTFAADWLPCGAARLAGVPLVWGPVGGATYLPVRMARWVGVRGFIGETGRSVFTRICRRLWGDPAAARAEVVITQNAEVAHRFRAARKVVVEPNAALGPMPSSRRQPGSSAGRAIFVARLVAWKGAGLAISALAEPPLREWTLDVYGSGPEDARMRQLAERLGVADRVVFHGHTARAEVLEALAHADVLLFPSLHDSAGWAAAEASAMGCPVVCFDHGGPALLAGPNAHVVAMGGSSVPDLAAAAVRAAGTPVAPYDRWSRGRLPGLVHGWYQDAVSSRSG